MLNQVQNFIQEHGLLQEGEPVILACSGGKDSMVLLDVLRRLNYAVVVAHCNYQLRGEESNDDEEFLRDHCENHGFEFRSIQFDCKSLSRIQKKSVQELARSLRYDWLEEVRLKEKAAVIVTAHHLQDNIETLIFKLIKGTGIKGVRGILPKNGKIVRPLLNVSLEDIRAYVKKEGVSFREDSSNASDNYDRNKIRHQLTEPMKEINPQLSETMRKHFARWRDIEQMHDLVVDEWRRKLIKEKKGSYFISIQALMPYNQNKSLLYELLQPYGFNSSDTDDIYDGLLGKESKEYLSRSHRIIKDRKFLVITSLQHIESASIYTIPKGKTKLKTDNELHLEFQYKPIGKLSKINKRRNYAYIDTAWLEYPLVLRKWEMGDYFYPLGLQRASGKASKKNIGKFLRDEKVSALDKEQTWVLTSNQKVVWVLGYRLDERFKLTEQTKEVLKITIK